MADNFYYVPVNPNPACMALGQFPESVPGVETPHFDSEEQAKEWQKNNQPPEHVRYDNGITYGPKHESVKWPTVQMLYTVEPKEHKIPELEMRAKPDAGYIVIDPSAIRGRHTIVHRDVLHNKDIEIDDAVPLGEKLDNEEMQRLIQARGEALMKFQQMLKRSERTSELVDMDRPEVAESIRAAYVRKEGETLAEKTMQHVAQDIGEKATARTVIQLSAIRAKFAEQLANQDPNIPETERVAVAMTHTLSSFAAQVPSRDVGIIRNLQATIRGTVDELSAEQKAQEQSQHEIGAKPSEIDTGDKPHDASEYDEYGEEEYGDNEPETPGDYD